MQDTEYNGTDLITFSKPRFFEKILIEYLGLCLVTSFSFASCAGMLLKNLIIALDSIFIKPSYPFCHPDIWLAGVCLYLE
jgi:hypothetical protein